MTDSMQDLRPAPREPLRNGLLIAAFFACCTAIALTLSGRSVVFGSNNVTSPGVMDGKGARAAALSGFPQVTDQTLAEIYGAFEANAKKGDPVAAGFVIDLARAQRRAQEDAAKPPVSK
jgi:hypothetical protein